MSGSKDCAKTSKQPTQLECWVKELARASNYCRHESHTPRCFSVVSARISPENEDQIQLGLVSHDCANTEFARTCFYGLEGPLSATSLQNVRDWERGGNSYRQISLTCNGGVSETSNPVCAAQSMPWNSSREGQCGADGAVKWSVKRKFDTYTLCLAIGVSEA